MPVINVLNYLLVVTVHEDDVRIESREIGKDDKRRTMRQQSAYFKKPSRKYPEFFKFSLPDDQMQPYPAGQYLITPDCFVGGDYDSLEFNRYGIRLLPLPPEFLALSKS